MMTGNIMDYLEWYGDFDFSVMPFNEVDNLILAELSYASLDGIVPEPQLGSCLLYTSPSPRDGLLSRMPSSA